MSKLILNKLSFKLLLSNQRLLLIIWLAVTVVGVATKYSLGAYNNYLIYTGVFDHFVDCLPLYGPYPDSYFDMNHYGMLFAFVIAPFALLPDFWGLMLWMICGMLCLFTAIRTLPIERKWQSLILWISINELYTCVVYQQFNIATAALILFTFILIEKRRESFAVLLILLGTFVKIYGIISLAFFFFVKRKFRFIGYFILIAIVLFVLPMIFVEHAYVIEQYKAWIADIAAKNEANMFSVHQNMSLLGVIRKISGSAAYSDLWIIGGAVVLFMLSYLRIKQYKNLHFRMMMLASILLFIPLFSSGSESCSYLMAMVGVGLWWAITPLGRSVAPSIMLGLVIFASFAGNILPRDIYVDFFHKYAIKAVPFAIVWFRVSYEMLICNFETKAIIANQRVVMDRNANLSSCDVDVVLPCYNPNEDWVDVIKTQFTKFKVECPNHHFNLIVSNDGSHQNVGPEYVKALLEIENVTWVNNDINMGKGAALRSGVLLAKSPLVLYTDIDFPYQPGSMKRLLEELESGDNDIVLASRNSTYYEELSFVRRLLSFASKFMNKKVLGMKYADAQGGLKGFNRVGREIFLQTTIERFLFDTEFIYKASKREDIRMTQITANLRENIELPEMGLKVIRREFLNFLKILFNR